VRISLNAQFRQQNRRRFMGDLTKFAQEESATVQAIYAWWEKQEAAEAPRAYLGASQIGAECDRQLWYSFRTYEKEPFSGRMLRLFNRGHREEAVFVEELRGIGCEVVAEDSNGNQFEVRALGGHFKGHMDGAALGVPEAPKTWHVCEFKTHNAKSFTTLKASGVKKAKPQHYWQMMVYMGLTGMTRALYLAVNKDTDELYSERIRYDATEFKQIMARAKRIIEANTPPERIAGRSDDGRCKFCSFRELCWGLGQAVLPLQRPRNCRTCCHATAVTDNQPGGWFCEKHKKLLDDKQVASGCEDHLLLPGFLVGSSPVDATDDSIEYVTEDGTHWVQGKGYWTPEELGKVSVGMLADRSVVAKEAVSGMVETVAEEFAPGSLLDQFPWEDSEKIWDGPEPAVAGAVQQHLPMGLQIVDREETEDHVAVRYSGNCGDYLLVVYSRDKYAAIWKGKE
jgi:CRISPR/Cas system-associated exonuclease Cas4 (RecB family)